MAKKTAPIENVKNEDKLKAIEAAVKGIEKEFGKGALMKLGDRNNFV